MTTTASFGVDYSIQALLESGIIVKRGGKLSVAPDVPKAYLTFLSAVWRHVVGTHRHFPTVRNQMKPTMSYSHAKDGAPRIFGLDLRLRNCMALAKYGPMNILDLRKLTGTYRLESADYAPFGRGGVARTWSEGNARVAMLDPAHPVAAALRRYLLKMEELYPLPPFERAYPKPKPPKKEPWVGDRLALFGSPIPTSILFAIAPLGWTYEALCVTLATGYHRENVKKAIMRLEKEGVIEGDRPRKGGFNVRIYRIAKKCPARQELIDLLAACVKAWPQIEDTVLHAVHGIHPKTKEHLRLRGVMARPPKP